jgi:mono/diheme cytochrome c family protein
VLKPFLILVVLVFLEFFALAQQGQTPPKAEPSVQYTIPIEAVRKVNPVKPTAESIARGKRLYGYDCAMCHGKDGDGKGNVAEEEKLKIGDFRDPAALKEKTDGELFYILKNGKGQMPPENRGSPDKLWDLVNYIRSLSSNKASPEGKGAPLRKNPTRNNSCQLRLLGRRCAQGCGHTSVPLPRRAIISTGIFLAAVHAGADDTPCLTQDAFARSSMKGFLGRSTGDFKENGRSCPYRKPVREM